MGNKTDIGKAFKEKLDALNKTPGDQVWNSISADLDKRRKRRFLFWYMLVFVGLTLLLSGVYFGINKPYSVVPKAIPATQKVVSVPEKTSVKTVDETDKVSKNDSIVKNKKITVSKKTTTKRLLKSSASEDEYEVVTKYKIYVKKSKSVVPVNLPK